MPGPETPHAQGKVGLGAKKGAGALAGREGGGFRKPAGGCPCLEDGFSDGGDEQNAVALGSDVAQFLRKTARSVTDGIL